MTVHNHGPDEGRGLDCPERRIDGKLRGACMTEPTAQASQDRPRRDETPADGGADGQDAPDASTGRTRDQAHQAAHHAQTQGGQAGIASGLAAIAYAILAGQEPR